MTAKHTPGPWLLTIEADAIGEPAQLLTGNGWDIATLWGGYLAAAADARLIAAAPDLLEALKALQVGWASNEIPAGAWAMARAAIAKATGEAQ